MWALGHPGYIAIVPHGIGAPLLIAYLVENNSPQFLGFFNYWLKLKDNEGLQTRLYNHWILGQDVQFGSPRWSIMQNVLHIREK